MEPSPPPENVARRSESAQDSSRPPCRFYLLGKCKFGDKCTFSHDPRGRIPVCSFFEKNRSCRYGKDCKFLHGAPSEGTTGAAGAETSGVAGAGPSGPVETVQLDPGDNCGICLENIPASGKRFGLLNCDHVYCVDCLRTWRKSKGPQKDISRTCPECRKVSFFLVPSKEHLKGRDKAKAIQEYKKGLSKLPCKYHKPDGSTTCPFGWRCFYAHLDENGVDVKDRAPAAQAGGGGRRSCPYLRGNPGRGAARAAAATAAPTTSSSSAGARGRPEDFEFWGDEALTVFNEPTGASQQSRGRPSIFLRLQQLMLEIGGL